MTPKNKRSVAIIFPAILAVLWILSIAGQGPDEAERPSQELESIGVENAADNLILPVKACEIWFAEDSSAGAQKRMRIFAASNAEIGEERAATAMYVALRAIQVRNYDFVDVFLVPDTAKKDRNLLDATTAVSWVRYAPNPARIPFMETHWSIKYKTGNTTDVLNEYGNKAYEFEDYKELKGSYTLDADKIACSFDRITFE